MKFTIVNYKLKKLIKEFFQKIGIIVKPLNVTNDESTQISYYLSYNKIQYVLDIGANKGQFAKSILKKNSNFKILSVEPIKSCHKELIKESKNIKNWMIYKRAVAISDSTSIKEFHITRSDHSSSLLHPINSDNLDQRILKAHEVIEEQQIKTITIKQLIDETEIDPNKTCLKLDIQGMEYKVIRSVIADKIRFKNIIIEASLEPLYYGEKSFENLKELLFKNNYKIDIIRSTLVSEKNFKTLQINVCLSLIE